MEASRQFWHFHGCIESVDVGCSVDAAHLFAPKVARPGRSDSLKGGHLSQVVKASLGYSFIVLNSWRFAGPCAGISRNLYHSDYTAGFSRLLTVC